MSEDGEGLGFTGGTRWGGGEGICQMMWSGVRSCMHGADEVSRQLSSAALN